MGGRLASLVRIIGLASVLPLLASVLPLVAAPAPVWAAVSHPGSASGAGSLAGAVAAQGRLVSASGGPISGVRVVLYAWPGQSVEAGLRPGQQVPLRTVGSARTTATGRYVIHVTSPAALRASAARDGTINLELITSSRAGWAAFSFPRRLVVTASGTTLAAATDANAAGAVTPPTADLRLMRRSADVPRTPNIQCGLLQLVSSFGPQDTTVGSTYSHVSGMAMKFIYGNGQSSGLGVGVSSSGSFGTWSASGTHSWSSSSSESWPTQYDATSTHYKTGFVYGKYLVECDGYQTQVDKFAGGTSTTNPTPPSATYCRTFLAGSTFTKTTTSAYTYSGGVNISGTIGIDLSAHTGYSTTAELSYHFNTSRYLCGTDDYPGGTPKRLVAGLG